MVAFFDMNYKRTGTLVIAHVSPVFYDPCFDPPVSFPDIRLGASITWNAVMDAIEPFKRPAAVKKIDYNRPPPPPVPPPMGIMSQQKAMLTNILSANDSRDCYRLNIQFWVEIAKLSASPGNVDGHTYYLRQNTNSFLSDIIFKPKMRPRF